MDWADLVIGVIGIVIGVLGVLLTVRPLRPRPVFQSQGFTLIEGPLEPLNEKLHVYYDGERIDRVSITRVVFWNDSRSDFSGSRVVSTDPIQCSIDGGRVLSVRVIGATREASEFEAEVVPGDKASVRLKFDYLDQQDGALIELLHTSRILHPRMSGVIRGVPRGIKDLGRSSRAFSPDLIEDRLGNPWIVVRLAGKRRGINLDLATLLVYSTLLGLAIHKGLTGEYLLLPPLASLADWFSRVLLVSFGILAFLLVPVLLLRRVWRDRRRFPKALLIKEQ